jgi:hypothetical protein
MKYETFISTSSNCQERREKRVEVDSSPTAESDNRWLHARLTYSDMDNSSFTSSPIKKGHANYVEINAENIGHMLVRTIAKDLSISLKCVQLRCSVDGIIACKAIAGGIQKKLFAPITPSSNTSESVDVDQDLSLHTATRVDRTNMSDLHVSHSGALVSRCGDYNSNVIVLPILKRYRTVNSGSLIFMYGNMCCCLSTIGMQICRRC